MLLVIPAAGRHIYYQLQYRRCGKRSCTCHAGPGHGPYWYAFWSDRQGKRHSAYVGKHLPPGSLITPRQRARWETVLRQGEHRDGLGHAQDQEP
jgi:hypothetical protein